MATFDLHQIFPHCRGVSLSPPKVRTVKDYFNIARRGYDSLKAHKEYPDLQCWCIHTVENTSSSYFGAALLDLRIDPSDFANPNFRPKVIFVHRGTYLSPVRTNIFHLFSDLGHVIQDFWKDIVVADVLEISMNKVPSQFLDACQLVEKTMRYSGSRQVAYTHTGHSLGAGLAQLCAHKYTHPSKGFETPALSEILLKIDANKAVDDNAHLSFTTLGSLISKNYPTIPYFKSLQREHRGRVFTCMPKNPIVINPLSNFELLHLMKNMEPCLNSDGHFVTNPKTIK